jgi:hypothetical protein
LRLNLWPLLNVHVKADIWEFNRETQILILLFEIQELIEESQKQSAIFFNHLYRQKFMIRQISKSKRKKLQRLSLVD